MKRKFHKRHWVNDHNEDWLMTYADMITLLLCFFAIFLTISIPREDFSGDRHHETALAQPTQEEPTELPDVFEGNLPFHGFTRSDLPTQALAQNTQNKTIDDIVDKNLFSDLAQHLNRLAPAGGVNTNQAGDRITTIEMSSETFFDSGSATLNASGKIVLEDVAKELNLEKFNDYQITVEGHTDDNPIQTFQFPSNWELSTARAAAVVQFFLAENISAERLRAAGYADTFPKFPNRDEWHRPLPENQAKNRRVVIKLEKIERAHPMR